MQKQMNNSFDTIFVQAMYSGVNDTQEDTCTITSMLLLLQLICSRKLQPKQLCIM